MTKKEVKMVDNMEVHPDHVVVSVNPKIYSLDVVYSAAYVLLDKAYVVIDGDPGEEIFVEVRAKDGDSVEVARELNNQLINYAVFKTKSTENRAITDSIVQRALATNEDSMDESYLDDPLGIAVPWEEKYGDRQEE